MVARRRRVTSPCRREVGYTPFRGLCSAIRLFPRGDAGRLRDGRQRQKHRLQRWRLIENSLDDFKLHESVTRIVFLRSQLRVDDNADTAQLLAKFDRDREYGAHKTLSDTAALGVSIDCQPSKPENCRALKCYVGRSDVVAELVLPSVSTEKEV